MSAQLYALGRWSFRNAGKVLVIWLLVAAVTGALALAFHGRFDDSFDIPGSSSQEALERLHMTFPSAAALTATAVVVAPEGTHVDELQSGIEASLSEFEDLDMVESARSPWFEFVDGQISDNGRAALITITLDVEETPTEEQLAAVTQAGERLEAALPAGSSVTMGGQAFDIELPEMSITEVVGVVLAFLVMAVMLGSLLAAIIPIVTALVGVGITVAVMLVGTSITTINSTTPILAVMLGTAVGIDYALFIYARHRDQLRERMDPEESISRAIGTAGTAVVFAGITNAIALTGLAVARIPFLTVMGIFASVAVVLAVAIALTALPAFAGLLGERMRPSRVRRQMAADAAEQEDAAGGVEQATDEAAPTRSKWSLFAWWVGVTTSRPIATIVAVTVVLGALTFPAVNLQLSLPHAGEQPPERSSRQAYDLIEEQFGPGHNNPLVITAGIVGSDDPIGLIEDMRADVEAIDGVEEVVMAVPNENADTAMLQVIPTTSADDPETLTTVERLRQVTDTWPQVHGVEADVTGFTAVQIDVTQRLASAIVPFGILVVGLSLILLAAVFRSVWVPIKTAVGFVLSVGAAFGLTQLVFNEGWFKEVVNLERPLPVISFLPILLMGILFGLAMDYEVFIVSRIREEYVHGKDALTAIRDGFVASGPVVTAAALIMFAVFAFFVPTGMAAIKAIAFALAVGVLIDAFLIRMTFVPAVLALLKGYAWWMPKWLDKALPAFDMEGEALTKQLSLAGWPGDGSLLHAEDIVVEGIVGPFTLVLKPGDVVGIVGPVGPRTAASMALGGRLGIASGRARVAGHLLPEGAGAVRRRTTYLDLATTGDITGAVDSLKVAEGDVILMDSIALVGTTAERQALEDLVARVRESRAALVCTASTTTALDKIKPDGLVAVREPELEGSPA